MTTQDQIASQILQTKSLHVSYSWLSAFLASSSNQHAIPLTAKTQTALFRILSSDFRETLSTHDAAAILPVDIANPITKGRHIPGPVPVQLIDLEDIGSSIWSQVEEIERVERGETVRGREIVRTVNVDRDSEGQEREQPSPRREVGEGGGSNGPHRLTLEDAAGTRVIGVELQCIPELGTGKLPIGSKMLLKNITVARGIVLLTPESVTLLGGKIEHLDRAWRKSRKQRLLTQIAEMKRPEQDASGDPDI